MRIKAQVIAAVLLAGLASAQNAPASQSVKQNATQTKAPAAAQKSPFSAKPASTQAPAKSPATSVKNAAPKAAKQTATTHTKAMPATSAAKAAVKHAAAPAAKKPEAAPAVAENAPSKLPSPGKRDPFMSPIALAAMKGPLNCSSAGKHCLVIDQVVLKGIVQMKGGNFALVENPAKKPYILHESDALFNGSVVKITGDSVIFKEDSSDILGRPVSKEVVKKVSAPAV